MLSRNEKLTLALLRGKQLFRVAPQLEPASSSHEQEVVSTVQLTDKPGGPHTSG
jgi:hypothetical protein